MLTQTLLQMRTNVRRTADIRGDTALARHPDADINDYINQAIGSLHRRLTEAMPDQRILASTTITTSSGVATYSLPAAFEHLISAELVANGTRRWLEGYEMHERAMLASPDASYTGVPLAYRLRGDNIELLPTPQDAYSVLLWYVPTMTTLAADAATYDTICRLDGYITAYAARLVAVRDKNMDLVSVCAGIIAEFIPEIESLRRNRDKNSPPRIVDEMNVNRFGRRSRGCR